VVLTDPIGLVIPPSLQGMTDVEQVFVMGRYVANVARHAAVVDALTESELSLALAAAANIVDLPVDDSRLDPAELALSLDVWQRPYPGLLRDALRKLPDATELRLFQTSLCSSVRCSYRAFVRPSCSVMMWRLSSSCKRDWLRCWDWSPTKRAL
jgi:hypothetical protein